MRWLSRFSAPVFDRVRNESGAVIVFVAVAMVALLAMTAFVIDFGRIWQERRELQAGATAGVLAVAEDCARDLLCDLGSARATAEIYADANAIDGAAWVFDSDLDLTDQTMRVVTATENTAGGNTLHMMFAGIVGFGDITVGADAAAAWGTPLGAATLPLIISDCEWNKDPSVYPGWPGGNPDGLPKYPAESSSLVPGNMVTIDFHDPLGADECTIHPGLDLPGGFGWLDTTGGCTAEVIILEWISADPGSSPSNGCSPSDFQNLIGEVVNIPYFSEVQGQGDIGQYEVAGLGAFVIAGYRFGGQYQGGVVSCAPPTSCLAGWFVDYVSNAGTPGGLGGEDRGLTVIKLIG